MNKYKFKNLIFCGGGIKLYTFIGAIKVLEENDILSNITTYIGTSIGGLISALLNINYTHSELYKFIESFNLNEIIDIDISNLYTNNYGLDNGDKIEKFIRILFKAKIERSNITFKELYDLTNKHLIISATCLTTRKIVYFDHKNYPDLDVIDGIRMAITIPLFFTYKRYNDQIYVDGGILDQFPIHLLNSLKELRSINSSKNEVLSRRYLEKASVDKIRISSFSKFISSDLKYFSTKYLIASFYVHSSYFSENAVRKKSI